VLALFHRVGQRFGEEDFEILRLVAANVSTAVRLYNARTAREIGERLTTVGRLLSQVIHDFKAPMTVISGYVQLMAEADDRAQRQAYCEDILRQFDTLTEMQREVLEFARGESKIFVRKVYLRKFFLDLTRQIQLEIGERPIELKVEVDSKLVARFDEGRMTRALHNLGRNAIEAMADRGGELGISAALDGDDLVIRVSDTGPGIPPEIEHRLFQSFVTSGKVGGTGLGLAIVRKIAEEHGGSVSVSSSPRGASFELRLPQAGKRSDKGPRKPRSRSSPRIPVPKSG
jgi:signal transduction histidine kinase